jgi:hypothetical protein
MMVLGAEDGFLGGRRTDLLLKLPFAFLGGRGCDGSGAGGEGLGFCGGACACADGSGEDGGLVGSRIGGVVGCGRGNGGRGRSVFDDDDFAKAAVLVNLLDLGVLDRIAGSAFAFASASGWCGLDCWALGMGVLGHNLRWKRVDGSRHGLGAAERRGGREREEMWGNPGSLLGQIHPQLEWGSVWPRATHSGSVRSHVTP